MAFKMSKEVSQRKNFKANRVQGHQRFYIAHDPCPQSPDEILIDKIIKNIKQEMKGKDEKKENKRGVNSIWNSWTI